MTEELIKIMKEAEKERHNNHITAGQLNWENVRLQAKKEVIDIVLSYFYNRAFSRDEIEIKVEDMKQRHLSTFANEQKQHNNDFKKVCPECGSQDGKIWIEEWHCDSCNVDTVIRDGKPIPKS